MCLRRRQQQKVEEVEEVPVLWSGGQHLGNFIHFTLYSARLCYATSENAKHTCLQEGV